MLADATINVIYKRLLMLMSLQSSCHYVVEDLNNIGWSVGTLTFAVSSTDHT